MKFDEPDYAAYAEAMRVKTSITVDLELLRKIDKLSGPRVSRSAFIEAALRKHIASATHNRISGDLQIINNCADDLNEEALDVLDYQAAL